MGTAEKAVPVFVVLACYVWRRMKMVLKGAKCKLDIGSSLNGSKRISFHRWNYDIKRQEFNVFIVYNVCISVAQIR